MKNFRKVLALVLVVATLFSFTAMTSAKTYTDADKISYNEAVDVLSAVGILNGYEDDSFKPTQTISREEMAKMIAVLANSGSDVSTLYASACGFADVPTVRWSASYVAYCNKTGIVAGRSNTTFDPTAKVTGIETAKMLLVVLGFDAEEQGYIGADWKVNILRDAKVMGLLNNFADDYDVDAAITREEAANMMLNALKAPAVVGILSKNVVTVTNALVFNSAELKQSEIGTYVKVNSYATLLDAMKAGKWALYGNVVISDDLLHESLFKGLTFTGATTVDCFGRAVYGFTYTKNGIIVAQGTYAGASGKQYTTAVDIKADYAKQLATGKYTVKVVINGTEKTFADNNAAIAYIETKTGNGVDTLVSTSWNGETGTINVNIIETYIAKVTNVNDYTKTFSLVDNAGNAIATSVKMSETVKAGQYVLYRVCNNGTHKTLYGSYGSSLVSNVANTCVHDYTVATSKTITVDYSRHYTNAHVDECYVKSTEGDTFKYDHNYGDAFLGATATDNLNATVPGIKATKVAWLDKYGYVMLLTDVAEEIHVAYFEEGSLFETQLGTSYGTPVYKVTSDAAVFTGAATANTELTEVVIKNDDTLETQLTNVYNAGKTGYLAAYTLNAKGEAEQYGAGGNWITYGQVISNASHVIDATAHIYADSDTCFMLRSVDAKTGAWTYSEVVGWRNLPDGVKFVVTKSKNATGTNAQYMDLDGDKYADYVFIETLTVKTASEFFVMGTEKYQASWTGVAGLIGGSTYSAYRALVNGVDSIVLTTGTLKIGLYTGGVTYKDVVMTEDGENLPLYISNSEATKCENANNLTIKVDSNNDVYVDYVVDGTKYSEKGAETVTVYHILPASSLNEYNGYWIESNKLNTTLAVAADYGYVVFNSSNQVVAIYLYDAK